jgi:hypothetical protein
MVWCDRIKASEAAKLNGGGAKAVTLEGYSRKEWLPGTAVLNRGAGTTRCVRLAGPSRSTSAATHPAILQGDHIGKHDKYCRPQ